MVKREGVGKNCNSPLYSIVLGLNLMELSVTIKKACKDTWHSKSNASIST